MIGNSGTQEAKHQAPGTPHPTRRGIFWLHVAVVSTLGCLVALAQVDPVSTGRQLGQMTASMVLGVALVAETVALVWIYKRQEAASAYHHARRDEREERFMLLIDKHTTAASTAVEVQRELVSVMQEVRAGMKSCEDTRKILTDQAVHGHNL